MHDYDLADREVSVSIPRRVFDPKYTKLLIRRSDISLPDIILLDRLQKGMPIEREEARDLRSKGLVEGRYPRLFPAGEIATAGEKTAEYLEAKGFDDTFYTHRILQFICQKRSASRTEIEHALAKHLSSTLTDKQKKAKVDNMLSLDMGTRKKMDSQCDGKRPFLLDFDGSRPQRMPGEQPKLQKTMSPTHPVRLCKTFVRPCKAPFPRESGEIPPIPD